MLFCTGQERSSCEAGRVRVADAGQLRRSRFWGTAADTIQTLFSNLSFYTFIRIFWCSNITLLREIESGF